MYVLKIVSNKRNVRYLCTRDLPGAKKCKAFADGVAPSLARLWRFPVARLKENWTTEHLLPAQRFFRQSPGRKTMNIQSAHDHHGVVCLWSPSKISKFLLSHYKAPLLAKQLWWPNNFRRINTQSGAVISVSIQLVVIRCL